jgi:type I restriction enzyme S subunit
VKIANIEPPRVNLVNGERIPSDKVAGLDKFQLNDRDIVMAMTGATIGKVGRIRSSESSYLNQRVAKLSAKAGREFDDFIYALVSQAGFDEEVLTNSNGSAQANISTDGIGRILVPDFTLAEQLQIGRVIGSLDDKIELNRRMNETLEALAQSLFKSWFVDATQSALPKGWREATIRDLASNIQYGLTQSASTEPVGPHFLRITDIQGGRVNWGNVPYCKVSPEEHERYRIKPGDVLVARTGASTGENIYLPVAPDAVFASYLVRFQFAEPSMARLVGAFMRTPAYFEFVAGCIGGSAQPNASAQVLAGATLVVPPPELAKQFADTVAPFDKRIAANNEESRTLAALRDTLLPKLLSGELRVLAPLDAQEAKT